VSVDVLVIEDDAAIGENLVELLESEGHRVRWGHDGMEGLQLLDGTLPDVILLDLLMPRMNGFQFREAQKADPRAAQVPVIVISAHARAHEIDAQEFLEKPFDVAHLLGAVERLGGARA
jgi:two-component system chemotaxis response regulator CheY